MEYTEESRDNFLQQERRPYKGTRQDIEELSRRIDNTLDRFKKAHENYAKDITNYLPNLIR